MNYLSQVVNAVKKGETIPTEPKWNKWVQSEIEKQGLEKYVNGDYSLGKLDKFGQRINIRVEIPDRKSGGTVSFVTGWMVSPDGQITLNTPYGWK